MTNADDGKGIHRKYKIERTDGSSKPGGKHEHCAYFVLDLEHDPFALKALRAYARACRKTHPKLAEDIDAMLAARPCGHRGLSECFCFGPQTPSEMAGRLMSDD